MKSDRPVVYMTTEFLKNFFTTCNRPFTELPVNVKKIASFLDELICQRADLRINLERSEIIDFLKGEDGGDPLLAALIRRLVSNGSALMSCRPQLQDFEGNLSAVRAHPLKPSFILGSEGAESANKISEKTGVIVIPKKFDQATGEFHHLKINSVPSKISVSGEEQLSGINKAYAAIIQDPYLFSIKGYSQDIVDQKVEFLADLIRSILIDGRVSSVFPTLTIITHKGKDPVVAIMSKLKEELVGYVEIEHFAVTSIHDRFILTTTGWISSGQTFAEEYAHEDSKILFIPIGLYYQPYVKKLRAIANNLKNSGFRSRNPIIGPYMGRL